MKDDEILNHLNAMSEDEMIEAVIVPLYQKRFPSFFDVEFSGKDKREDRGIDITYYEIGRETDAKEYCGVQAKQGDINTGKSANGIAAISIQAQQAFNKAIANTRDKKNYRIQGYTVLTTGNILAKARSQIVDQFEHKTIRFVDGKTLCGWIREYWLEDIKALCGTVDEHEEDEDFDPVATIVEHLQKRCARDIAKFGKPTTSLMGPSKILSKR
jgi:Restriction endonuclease